MADEILKSKHAFGNIENLDQALASGKIDSYDILFLTTPTGHAIGWIDRDGNKVILKDNDTKQVVVVNELPEVGESGMIYVFGNDGYIWNGTEFVNMCKPTDLTELQQKVDKKADAEEVEAKIGEIESTLDDVAKVAYSHEKVKYEFTDVPDGTLVKINENEIRVMCPADSVWKKQNVGTGGDPNCYYGTFKTYVPSDDIVGYIEHLGNQVDEEILTTFSTDKYGRRYQPTWLALARFDSSADKWSYYGASSTIEKYIGWDYQIDWYNADGVVVASDSIRINLSNEKCHSVAEPYYVGSIRKEVDTRIEEKIAEVEAAYEIVEF